MPRKGRRAKENLYDRKKVNFSFLKVFSIASSRGVNVEQRNSGCKCTICDKMKICTREKWHRIATLILIFHFLSYIYSLFHLSCSGFDSVGDLRLRLVRSHLHIERKSHYFVDNFTRFTFYVLATRAFSCRWSLRLNQQLITLVRKFRRNKYFNWLQNAEDVSDAAKVTFSLIEIFVCSFNVRVDDCFRMLKFDEAHRLGDCCWCIDATWTWRN